MTKTTKFDKWDYLKTTEAMRAYIEVLEVDNKRMLAVLMETLDNYNKATCGEDLDIPIGKIKDILSG